MIEDGPANHGRSVIDALRKLASEPYMTNPNSETLTSIASLDF